MRWTRCIALIAMIAAGADALPDDGRPVSLVPWKVLDPGESVEAPLVLFWIPSSPEELRRSALLTSDDLTLYSSRCVAMRVVRFDDRVRLARLQVEADLPVAILADASGKVLAAVESEHGMLSVRAVEEAVREELETRVGLAESRLDQARHRAEEGQIDAALELYRAVWDTRCVCPRQARVAQKALKRLERR